MLERLRNIREDGEGGFTLVELLIVIVILGVLAAIVVFSVSGVTDKGAKSSCSSNVKAIDVAAESSYAQGKTATTLGALVTNGFLHADSNFTASSGTSVDIGTTPNKYTITYTPSTSTTAGGADSTTCTLS